jgi:hypothetical protein
MRNRSRLDLICVPCDTDTVLPDHDWLQVVDLWQRAGFLTEALAPTEAFVDGGGSGLVVDRPTTRVVYGNQLGGIRVRCPACGEGMARAFAAAVEEARLDGALRARCTACGANHDLEALDARPPFRIGRSALIFQDVQGSRLTEAGQQAVAQWMGPFSVVLRRVS